MAIRLAVRCRHRVDKMTKIDSPSKAGHPSIDGTGGKRRAERELIEVLHSIMENFVDRAFCTDPVQQATAQPPSNVSPDYHIQPRRDRRRRSSKRQRSGRSNPQTSKTSNKRKKIPCQRKTY